MGTLTMKLGDQQPLFVPHASIAGTSNAGGAFAEVKLPEDYHYSYPVLNQVLTSIGNRPHYLFPGQWQADNDLNYDHSITNYVEAKDNAGSANWDFVDVNNVNNSLDANTNAYRSNANGLQHQFGKFHSLQKSPNSTRALSCLASWAADRELKLPMCTSRLLMHILATYFFVRLSNLTPFTPRRLLT